MLILAQLVQEALIRPDIPLSLDSDHRLIKTALPEHSSHITRQVRPHIPVPHEESHHPRGRSAGPYKTVHQDLPTTLQIVLTIIHPFSDT
jgi:hypothetical protein